MRETSINGIWDLLLPDHRAAQWAEWVDGWERERIVAVAAAIADAGTERGVPPVVYDIGAEQGDMPCLWAALGARVLLAEPSPDMWPTIRRTFELNDVAGQVAGCYTGFVGNDMTAGAFAAFIAGPWPAASQGPIVPEPGFGHLNEAAQPVCTIDWLAETVDEPPDVITIDVEGSELAVMQGAVRVLETARPTVFISIHPEFMADRYDTRPDELHGYMAEAGYVAEWLATDHEQHFCYTPEERT